MTQDLNSIRIITAIIYIIICQNQERKNFYTLNTVSCTPNFSIEKFGNFTYPNPGYW